MSGEPPRSFYPLISSANNNVELLPVVDESVDVELPSISGADFSASSSLHHQGERGGASFAHPTAIIPLSGQSGEDTSNVPTIPTIGHGQGGALVSTGGGLMPSNNDNAPAPAPSSSSTTTTSTSSSSADSSKAITTTTTPPPPSTNAVLSPSRRSGPFVLIPPSTTTTATTTATNNRDVPLSSSFDQHPFASPSASSAGTSSAATHLHQHQHHQQQQQQQNPNSQFPPQSTGSQHAPFFQSPSLPLGEHVAVSSPSSTTVAATAGSPTAKYPAPIGTATNQKPASPSSPTIPSARMPTFAAMSPIESRGNSISAAAATPTPAAGRVSLSHPPASQSPPPVPPRHRSAGVLLMGALGVGEEARQKEKKKNNKQSTATETATGTGFAGLNEHWLDLPSFAQRFSSSNIDVHDVKKSMGLSKQAAKQLLGQNGPNSLTPPPLTPWWVVLLRQFTNVFMVLLMVAGVLSFVAFGLTPDVMMNLYLGIVLFVVVFATCISTFLQEHSSSKVMETFKKMMPSACMVVRDGEEVQVPASELVVGDIVKVGIGEKVPADLRVLLTAGELKVECSSITGEAEPVRLTADHHPENVPGNEARCLAFSGSLVLEGTCIGVVIRTGDNTMIGQIAGQASKTSTGKSTLQVEVSHFVYFIAELALILACIFFTVGAARTNGRNIMNTIVNGFLIIFLSNIPQGLPATVMSLLTVVARRLASRNVFVKKLDSIETLGSTTTIASDKTGTLTQNRMTCSGVWTDGEFLWGNFHEIFRQSVTTGEGAQEQQGIAGDNILRISSRDLNGASGRPSLQLRRSIQLSRRSTSMRSSVERRRASMERRDADLVDARFIEPIVPKTGIQHIYVVAAVCNRVTFDGPEPEVNWQSRSAIEERAMELKLLGSPSEIALMRWCELCMPSRPTRSGYNVIFEIPFNSTTKVHLMVVAMKLGASINASGVAPPPRAERDYTLLMKGAPERILDRCSTYWSHGKEFPINEDFKQRFDSAYRRFGSGGQRVLGFAHRVFTAPTDIVFDQEQGNYPSTDLCFLGLTAITDPPRENVPDAVRKCQTAGIRVAMVTGDHVLTACAIARQVNILPPDSAEDLPDVDEQTARTLGLSPYIARFAGLDWAYVEGSMVDSLTDADWDELMDKHSLVFARVTPNHKYLIVEQCQKHEEIVAVTGDGVNDAPALKRAHIGVAMGKNGSEVAREAAMIVLMDDNFASIVEAVEQGRLVFSNLMKTIAYTLTHLLPELLPVVLGLVVGFPVGLSSLQLLSIDLLTEVGPAVSLAYEEKEADIMSLPPRNAKTDRLASIPLLVYSYLVAGVIEALGGLAAYLLIYYRHGIYPSDLVWAGDNYFRPDIDSGVFCTSSTSTPNCFSRAEQLEIAGEAAAGWYLVIVIAQAFHIWTVKVRRVSIIQHGRKNFNLVTIIGVCLAISLVVIFIYTPVLRDVMGSSPVNYIPWVTGIITGLIIVFVNETRKLIGRRHPRAAKYIMW